MFDSPFDFFALLIAIVAFIFARKAFNQAGRVARAAGCDRSARRLQREPVPAAADSIVRARANAGSIVATAIAAEQPPDAVGACRSQPACGADATPTALRLTPPPRPATRARLRGAHRHPLGGLGRRIDAGARRLLHGPLFDRRGTARARRAHCCSAARSRWRCLRQANGRAARRASPRSKRCRSPTSPRSSPPPGPPVAFATVYAAYALYDFLAPATAFILLGMVALGTLAAALLHGPALAGLGIAAAFVTPVLVSSEQTGLLGAVYLSRHRHRGGVRAGAHPAVALARGHHHRVRAALDLPLPAMRPVDGRTARIPCDRRDSSLAALLVVCGFMFGPPADEGQIEPISSGSLARLSVWRNDDRAEQLPCRYRHHRVRAFWWPAHCWWHGARRPPPAQSAPRRCSSSPCLPNGLSAAIRTCWCCRAGRCRASALPPPTARSALHLITAAIFAAGFGAAGFLAQGRFNQRADITVLWAACGRVHAAGAVDRALCPHRPSRSLDPVCDPGGDACGGVWRRDRNPHPARQPAGAADFDRAVRHRRARRAGAGTDLRAGKRLAHDRAGADVDGHGVDFDAAADSVPALRSPPFSPASWCCASATSRASSAMRSAPLRSSTGCCGATAFRRCRSGSAAIFLRRRGDDAAVANGGIGSDPVHGAAGVHGNPPCRQRRRCLPRQQRRPDRVRAAGVRRAGDGDRPGAAADPHRQHRPQCRRGAARRYSRASPPCSA